MARQGGSKIGGGCSDFWSLFKTMLSLQNHKNAPIIPKMSKNSKNAPKNVTKNVRITTETRGE